MKVIVTHNFKDKYTNEKHRVGDVLTLTDKRFREISAAAGGPYVEPAGTPRDIPGGGGQSNDG